MADHPMPIAGLNDASRSDFLALLGGVVEHSPWVAERMLPQRPFRSVADLHARVLACLRAAPRDDQVALFNLHPELAGREAIAGDMTESSMGEQGRLGLTRLGATEVARLTELNRAYREKFGFPFILALRRHENLASVLGAFAARLANTRDAEIDNAMAQISDIVEGRLRRLLTD